MVDGNEEDDEVSKMQSQKKGSPKKVGHDAAAAVLTDVEASGDGRKKMSCIRKGTEMAFEMTDAACRFGETVVADREVDPMAEEAVLGQRGV